MKREKGDQITSLTNQPTLEPLTTTARFLGTKCGGQTQFGPALTLVLMLLFQVQAFQQRLDDQERAAMETRLM